MATAIGLSGFARAGKTAAAEYIQKKYGIERRHIAEPLRAMLVPLMRANGISDEMINRYLEGDLKDGVVIPEIGATSRELQITLGTEWGRNHVHENLWANTWKRSVKPGDRVMNDSVRFPNEEDVIAQLDGFTIMITRPGSGPAKFKWGRLGKMLYERFGIMAGVHDSERLDRLNPTYKIRNAGTLEYLYFEIDEIMQHEGIYPLPAELRRVA